MSLEADRRFWFASEAAGDVAGTGEVAGLDGVVVLRRQGVDQAGSGAGLDDSLDLVELGEQPRTRLAGEFGLRVALRAGPGRPPLRGPLPETTVEHRYVVETVGAQQPPDSVRPAPSGRLTPNPPAPPPTHPAAT